MVTVVTNHVVQLSWPEEKQCLRLTKCKIEHMRSFVSREIKSWDLFHFSFLSWSRRSLHICGSWWARGYWGCATSGTTARTPLAPRLRRPFLSPSNGEPSFFAQKSLSPFWRTTSSFLPRKTPGNIHAEEWTMDTKMEQFLASYRTLFISWWYLTDINSFFQIISTFTPLYYVSGTGDYLEGTVWTSVAFLLNSN